MLQFYTMLCFIDESGDHNLKLNDNDQFPIFVLGAILIDEKEHENLTKEFNALKQEIFKSDDVIFHTAELIRPLKAASDKRFHVLVDKKIRNTFYKKLNHIIARTNFESIFCVIDKQKLVNKYKYPYDPYDISFENLLNRIITTSHPYDVAIYPEQRSSILDARIELTFHKYKQLGTRHHKADYISKRITEFEHVHKQQNIAGAQLIDLLVSPVGRDYLKIKTKPKWNEVTIETIMSTIKNSGNYTIFP